MAASGTRGPRVGPGGASGAGVVLSGRAFPSKGLLSMRLDTWLRGALPAFGMVLAMIAPASAQKSADTLRITWRDAIPDVDPYYNSLRTGMVVAFHAFDCLVYRDPPTLEIKPALATAWKQVDDT